MTETVITAVVTELMKYGLPGLFISYLLWINNTYREDNRLKALRIDELQELRVREAAENVRTVGALTMSNDKLAEALQALGEEHEKLVLKLDRRRA